MMLLRQAQAMRSVAADAVLLGPPSLRAGLTAGLSGIPLRIGYRGDGRDWLLSVGLKTPERGTLHYTREMLRLGAALQESWGWSSTADSEIDPVESYLPGCRDWSADDVGSGPPLWAVAPGATFGQAKTWPVAKVAEFLTLAVRGQGRRVVLLGDASSKEFCRQLRESIRLPWRESLAGTAGVIDRTGKTDLPGVVGLLKAAEGFVGNDSGLMHLAGVLGVPTVGIFGSSNPDWTAPGGPRTSVVVADCYPCRPCYRPTCNQERFCLEDISARQVLDSLTGLIVGDGLREGA